eukprot:TRINITY_DN216_c0_g1_i1.p1 TRINITY_DN216_c0_g1~~TRINITY_DN216_c0_g1_i1.p1  ORF type:complete len:297 (+),score=60.55 TRINITY_DN216_c0_g1_i1:128-1018(+)
MSTAGTKNVGDVSDANFPKDAEGRVYHLGVKKGEVANRILSVGDATRGALLSNFLDNPAKNFVTSNRGFTVYTGTRKGTPVSIIVTGMGTPMIDFVVRESRAVVDGNMAIVRFGTCGSPQPNIAVGAIAVAEQAVLIRRNVDNWIDSTEPPYFFSKPVSSDKELSKLLLSHLKSPYGVVSGLNATADSFYSSQGRIDPNFDDRNSTLIDDILKAHPNLISLEMETFKLLHLALCSHGTISAAACTIVLAQRYSGVFLSNEEKHELEKSCGLACLDSLVAFPLENVMDNDLCVWKKQ